VLAEYLVGGLTRARLRLLAGRVQACRALVDGADFIECFNMLTKVYGFPRRLAFGITTRVFRGGGITKDAVYLSGFLSVLKYVRAGHPLEELYVGKLSEKYAGLIRELRWRKVLGPATLVPPFLNQEEAKQRIIKLQQTSSIIELIKGTQK